MLNSYSDLCDSSYQDGVGMVDSLTILKAHTWVRPLRRVGCRSKFNIWADRPNDLSLIINLSLMVSIHQIKTEQKKIKQPQSFNDNLIVLFQFLFHSNPNLTLTSCSAQFVDIDVHRCSTFSPTPLCSVS